MKYKITAYVATLIATLLFIATVILGFKVMNIKDTIKNSNEDSVLVLSVVFENEEINLKPLIKYDVEGITLFSVLQDNEKIHFDNNGLIESVNGISNEGTGNNKFNWMIYSSTNSHCNSNTIVENQCTFGAKDLYFTSVNEFTLRYQTNGPGK